MELQQNAVSGEECVCHVSRWWYSRRISRCVFLMLLHEVVTLVLCITVLLLTVSASLVEETEMVS